MSVNQHPTRDRKLRAGMVLALVVAGTALIGWGGLAAWDAVTQNNGSTAVTEGVHMTNAATVHGGSTITCTDETSPTACGAIFAAQNITPGWSGTVGTVQITNTGTEASTFVLELTPTALPSVSAAPHDTYWVAADNTLCADLTLTITDATAGAHVVYSGPLTGMPQEAITDNNSNSTWATGASDVFTFGLALPTGNAQPTDEDSQCTASFTWAQTGA